MNESLADSKNSCTFATAIERESNEINGALVQLVRIHACHAWGHGFESRTHRQFESLNKSSRTFFISFYSYQNSWLRFVN